MLTTLEPGKIYRVKKEHSIASPSKHIFIYKCKKHDPTNVRMDFLEIGTGNEGYGHYTDPGIWEEVNGEISPSGQSI